ncbi:NHLP leader peptide family RiPP precursor [Thermodesulfobacteriota bacterium]
MAEQNEQVKLWAKIVARAWADEGFKQRLLDDPGAILAEEGMPVPGGMEIKVVEATENQVWLVLPPKPGDGKIEEGEERLAATLSYMSCAFPQMG